MNANVDPSRGSPDHKPPYRGRLKVERQAMESGELVVIRGEIDLGTAPGLGSELSDAVWRGRGPLVVDLTGVEFMDSTGLHLLLNALRRLRRQGRSLVVVCEAPDLLRLFETTGLTGTFTIVPTREAALAAV